MFPSDVAAYTFGAELVTSLSVISPNLWIGFEENACPKKSGELRWISLPFQDKRTLMERTFLFLASISGFISVALGAFGAHALKGRLDAYHLGVFRTGVEYQFYHTFALAWVGLMATAQTPLFRWSGWLFLTGIVIFSGSLYTLALTRIPWWGAITPLGGICFLVAWCLLALALYQR
jgi:uncharacterized membrane protein YgdD (TMEM256/DUF423 family)